MPTIYLSPSTQESNLFVSGGSEEYYMNLIADAMVPYLNASGIQYTRNTPQMTAASSISASNAGSYDLQRLFVSYFNEELPKPIHLEHQKVFHQ